MQNSWFVSRDQLTRCVWFLWSLLHSSLFYIQSQFIIAYHTNFPPASLWVSEQYRRNSKLINFKCLNIYLSIKFPNSPHIVYFWLHFFFRFFIHHNGCCMFLCQAFLIIIIIPITIFRILIRCISKFEVFLKMRKKILNHLISCAFI